MKKMKGELHHLEFYVKDLAISNLFWDWFMPFMNYKIFQKWEGGVSWIHETGTYLCFVQLNDEGKAIPNDRQGNGLNHLAFYGSDSSHFAELQENLRKQKIKILILKDDYICFEDSNQFAIEVYLHD